MKVFDCITIDRERIVFRYCASFRWVFPSSQGGARVRFCAVTDIPSGDFHVSRIYGLEMWDNVPMIILEAQVQLNKAAVTHRISAIRAIAHYLNIWAGSAALSQY